MCGKARVPACPSMFSHFSCGSKSGNSLSLGHKSTDNYVTLTEAIYEYSGTRYTSDHNVKLNTAHN